MPLPEDPTTPVELSNVVPAAILAFLRSDSSSLALHEILCPKQRSIELKISVRLIPLIISSRSHWSDSVHL